MSLPPLQPEQLVKPGRFDLRMSLIFAAVFIPLGVNVPYFPLWLEAKGFGPEQIAVILSAPIFLRVVTTPIISSMADRAKDRANVLIAISVAAFLMSLGYFLTPTYATVLAVTLAINVFWTPQSPLADSLALSGVRRFGSNYPRMRIWGSLSFLGANFFGGIILAATGADAVPVMITFGLFAAFAAALVTPRLGRPRVASPLSASGLQAAAPSLLNRYFLLFVTGTGVLVASHGLLYGFASIYWKAIGISDQVIGFLWAWSVVAEVVAFLLFNRVFGRVSSTTVLTVAGLAAIVRWIAFPMIEPMGLGVPGFFAVQTLHALSTGLLLIGLQQMIGETVPEERTGAAQGIAYFANGFSTGVVTLASGPLYESLGGEGFYVMAVIAAIGLGIIVAAALSPKGRARAATPANRDR
ncbi:MAG TPA: MFS transporter [Rhizobiaceae bacterium]